VIASSVGLHAMAFQTKSYSRLVAKSRLCVIRENAEDRRAMERSREIRNNAVITKRRRTSENWGTIGSTAARFSSARLRERAQKTRVSRVPLSRRGYLRLAPRVNLAPFKKERRDESDKGGRDDRLAERERIRVKDQIAKACWGLIF